MMISHKPAHYVCHHCGQEKPFTTAFFTPDRLARFGLKKVCKACRNGLLRQRSATASAHQVAQQKWQRYIQQETPEQRSARLLRIKQWRERPRRNTLTTEMATPLMDLAREAHQIARDHGFWSGELEQRNVGELLMLMVSELAEVLEEVRAGHAVETVYYTCPDCVQTYHPICPQDGHGHKPEGFPVELADLFIRALDLCGKYQIPIDEIVREKMAYNRSRPYRHGKTI